MVTSGVVHRNSEAPLGILLAENLPFVCSPMGIDDSVIASAAAAGSTACALYPGRANAATDRILAQPRLDVRSAKVFRWSGESYDSHPIDHEDVRNLHRPVQRLHLCERRQALLSVKTEHSQQVAGGTMKLSALVAKSHANSCLNNTSFTDLVSSKDSLVRVSRSLFSNQGY